MVCVVCQHINRYKLAERDRSVVANRDGSHGLGGIGLLPGEVCAIYWKMSWQPEGAPSQVSARIELDAYPSWCIETPRYRPG